MLRKPEQFQQEGSKVFRKAPVNTVSTAACAYAGIASSVFDEVDAMRDMRNNQYQGIEPSAQDVEYALDVMQRACRGCSDT